MQTSRRDIIRAFGLNGSDRVDLKRILQELEAEGHMETRRKTRRDPDTLPPVSVLQINEPDAAGDLFATPLEWHGQGAAPRILLLPRSSGPALGQGDRILARLAPVQGAEHQYEARLIRKISAAPRQLLGVFQRTAEGGRILPIDKGRSAEWRVVPGAAHGARDGELVKAEQAGPRGRMGLPQARVVERLGDPGAPGAVSLIAIRQHGIPDAFPDAAIAAADAAKPAELSDGRADLRALPLITIDPPDARDHDDAVYAHADDNPANPGGHVVWVAIADVAAYVRPGSALDREARKRGNSGYFPDRVVPMLPDRLSGDLCSLHEGVPRACIAVRMVFDAAGHRREHRFVRGLMRSAAALTYEAAQAAMDGAPTEQTAALLEPVLVPLFAAYRALARARDARQPLALDLPERQIALTEAGKVASVRFKDRLEAHRLIEEFMIAANVCAARTLVAKRAPLLFRVHEEPTPEKIQALRKTAMAAGYPLARGQVLQTRHLNRLLNAAAGTDAAERINMATLQSMTQAYYSPENFGHFGLALAEYAHFTSPIRRYADLIVHRALILVHRWGKDGLSPEEAGRLPEIGEHISTTERRAMVAERDTTDRYLAAYLSERVGHEFAGQISGVARFGAFVRMDETGADGLIPVRSLGRGFFHHDREAGTLTESETGFAIRVGQRVLVRLAVASPVTGGIQLELLSLDDKPLPRGPTSGRQPGPHRKATCARKKASKTRRPVRRKR